MSGTPYVVEERIDRALANNAWLNFFPSVKLEKLAPATSDHYPILLDHFLDVRLPCTQHNFRFKNTWKLELGFDNMLKESW